MNTPYVAKEVPLKFVMDLLDYLEVTITDVSVIEIDYRSVRITLNSRDEHGRLFIGLGGEVGRQTNDYPLQTWEDYEKETSNGNAT
jgi:hypothetical protein